MNKPKLNVSAAYDLAYLQGYYDIPFSINVPITQSTLNRAKHGWECGKRDRQAQESSEKKEGEE